MELPKKYGLFLVLYFLFILYLRFMYTVYAYSIYTNYLISMQLLELIGVFTLIKNWILNASGEQVVSEDHLVC